MKKIILAVSVLVVVAIGCLKKEDVKPCVSRTVAEDLPAMKKFATDSAITYQEHSSGILYQIIEPGTGATPNANSNVSARYRGRLLNGDLFDQSATPVDFNLSGVIQGWTIALQLLKEGGKMKMIIPSVLAYDCHPYYVAFHNQPLYFYVELVSVK